MDEENNIENVIGCMAMGGLAFTLILLIAFYLINFYR